MASILPRLRLCCHGLLALRDCCCLQILFLFLHSVDVCTGGSILCDCYRGLDSRI